LAIYQKSGIRTKNVVKGLKNPFSIDEGRVFFLTKAGISSWDWKCCLAAVLLSCLSCQQASLEQHLTCSRKALLSSIFFQQIYMHMSVNDARMT
jgi:hypothetical protein